MSNEFKYRLMYTLKKGNKLSVGNYEYRSLEAAKEFAIQMTEKPRWNVIDLKIVEIFPIDNPFAQLDVLWSWKAPSETPKENNPINFAEYAISSNDDGFFGLVPHNGTGYIHAFTGKLIAQKNGLFISSVTTEDGDQKKYNFIADTLIEKAIKRTLLMSLPEIQ